MDLSQPTEAWGPAAEEDRLGKYAILDMNNPSTDGSDGSIYRSGSLVFNVLPTKSPSTNYSYGGSVALTSLTDSEEVVSKSRF